MATSLPELHDPSGRVALVTGGSCRLGRIMVRAAEISRVFPVDEGVPT